MVRATLTQGKGARGWCGILALALLLICVEGRAWAVMVTAGGRTLSIGGYLNQGVGIGIYGDEYDTRKGFQIAVAQLLLEVQYPIVRNLRFFGSAQFNSDWAYPILSDDDDWDAKGFRESRDRLYVFDEAKDVLKELHLSFDMGPFFFRVGKQIVIWGETDGFRLMDQINPLDQRRGLTDVEFETTILPIWLLRSEYYPFPNVGLEFVFNPNVEFRGNEAPQLGNDKGGIWAPYVTVPLGGPYPNDFAYLGSLIGGPEEPDEWDSDGLEYAARVKADVLGAIMTLNYFYGIDNDPVLQPGAPDVEINRFDGRPVLHLRVAEGFYPRFKFVGTTFSRDITPLYVSALGGVAPTMRAELLYAFNTTFENPMGYFEDHEELRWAVAMDWKTRIRALNPVSYFSMTAQFYHRHVFEYPEYGLTVGAAPVEDDNYIATLLFYTSYMNEKLTPVFFWMRDITNIADLFKVQLTYAPTHQWDFTLGVVALDGSLDGRGFNVFRHKDQVYFTIGYKF